MTEIAATDSLGGRATSIGPIFVGNVVQCKNDVGVFERLLQGTTAADLSMATLGLERFDECHELIPITVTQVRFLEDCELTLTLFGQADKQPGDTREMLRTRAVDRYEQMVGRTLRNPTRKDLEGFRSMIRRMREQPL